MFFLDEDDEPIPQDPDMKSKWKKGDRVVIKDGSEFNGRHGFVQAYTQIGMVWVQVDPKYTWENELVYYSLYWPCYDHELHKERKRR